MTVWGEEERDCTNKGKSKKLRRESEEIPCRYRFAVCCVNLRNWKKELAMEVAWGSGIN